MSKQELNKVLVTVPYTGQHWETLTSCLAPAVVEKVSHSDTAKILEAIENADAAILGGNISDEMLAKAKKLRWVHCDMAGVNDSAKQEIFDRGITLTASAGRSAPVLAEHAFYFMLSLIYASRAVEQNQRDHKWENLYGERRGLFSKTLGVIGLGYTGRKVATLGKAFGMRVIGYDRNEIKNLEDVDELYLAENGQTIEPLLKQSDLVVLAVRLSDETFHMIDDTAFKAMKPTAYLVNMARGAVVDEAALVRALRNNVIAGAGSDVFETEPLGKDSPLWDMPNMMITSHSTPEVPDLTANSLEIICDNIKRFRNAQPLRNALEPNDVYTKAKK